MVLFTVIGARPQFIKAAVVSRALRHTGRIREVLVHTGQHYDANLSDVFFRELEMPPVDYNLGIGSGPHGVQTGRMLEALEELLVRVKPDRVLVYGDTNSTLAGALAAVKLRIPIDHVEAGLRSHNRAMPEEINRILTDQVSDLLFAPTETAVAHLRREGISPDRIRLVGDVMHDAALLFLSRAERESRVMDRLDLQHGGSLLATVHRAENTDDPLRLDAIFEGLAAVAREARVVVPLHPRTRSVLERAGRLSQRTGELQIVDPVGYLDMVMLEKNARMIVTDSGGVQKEAFFYRVPCVTLRDETEWVELVSLGWNRLVSPTSSRAVADAIRRAMDEPAGRDGQPYGDGTSAEKIAAELADRSVVDSGRCVA